MIPATQSKSIVWLHLSDLHLCEPKTGWDAHRVLEPLIKDLQHMEKEHGLLPQLIFFTGDAAFGNYGSGPGSTLTEQYQGIETFLTEVRKAFTIEIPKANFFLVPGNHDVDRSEVSEAQTHWIEQQSDPDKITQLIQGGKKEWKQFMERLTLYRQFLQDHDYTHLLNDPERLIYAEVREINGIKIGVGGFNSAWNCSRDSEKGKLWLGGNWQNGTIVNRLKKQKADLKLALIHHPPGWFVEQEDSKMRNQMERDFDFFLHGHEHQGWVNSNTDGHVRIAAAACYEHADQQNGYNFVRLNLESGEAEIWLRKFDGDGGGWIPRIIANKTSNDGLWRTDSLPCLLKFKNNISSMLPRQKPLLMSSEPSNVGKSITCSPHSETTKPLSLFYSYAHEDESFRKSLEKHLSNLRRQGLIYEWHDRKIIAGQSWADEIDENIEKADVILLLISSDFIDSDYCHEVEMKRALERHKQGLAIVVPVLLRATDLEGSPFVKLQGLPTGFKPIAKWKDQDEAYLDVVNGLRKLIKDMQEKPKSAELEKKELPVKELVVLASQSDSSFIRKVREEVKRILSTRRPAVLALRETLLKDQISNIVIEELLIPSKGAIDPEKAIRFWRKIVKDCLEKRRDLIPEIKRCANDVLGWLVLLVIRENEISRHSGTSLNFSNMAEIIVPVETPTGTGIFVSRLFEKQARLQLKGNLVHCTGWIDPGELEIGFFPYDRLVEIEREIYRQVFYSLPPANGNWLAELRNTLRLRFEDDQDIYYFTLPRVEYSDDFRIVDQLTKDLPHLKAIIIGTDQKDGDSILVMDENLLIPLLREFLLMLENFA